jgi:hypothetical protein
VDEGSDSEFLARLRLGIALPYFELELHHVHLFGFHARFLPAATQSRVMIALQQEVGRDGSRHAHTCSFECCSEYPGGVGSWIARPGSGSVRSIDHTFFGMRKGAGSDAKCVIVST